MTTTAKPPQSIIAWTPPRPDWTFYAGAFALVSLTYLVTLVFADTVQHGVPLETSFVLCFILLGPLLSLASLVPFAQLMSLHRRAPRFHQLLVPGALAFPLGWWISPEYFFWFPFAVMTALAAFTALERKFFLPTLAVLPVIWLHSFIHIATPNSYHDLYSLVWWPLGIGISAVLLRGAAAVVSFVTITLYALLWALVPGINYSTDFPPHDRGLHLASYGGLSLGIVLTVILGAIIDIDSNALFLIGLNLSLGFTVLPNLLILTLHARSNPRQPEPRP